MTSKDSLKLLSILFLVGFSSFASAYYVEDIRIDPSRTDFVVGPGKQELILKPGQSTVVEVTVSNRMGEKRVFNLETEDFKGTRDLNKTVELLGDEKGPYSLKDFIQFSEKTFTLDNGSRARIPVRISIPQNAEPGGFYGTLLVSTVKSETVADPGAGNAAASVPLNIRQGVLFFVRVEGEVKEDGKLVDFKIGNGRKYFNTNEEVSLQVIFENNGNVHLNPYGDIKVYNSVGIESAKIELEPWFSMPDSLRSREKKMSTASMFGRYSAVAHIYRGYGALDDDASYDNLSVSFWVIPWAKIGWSIVVLALVGLIVNWFRKNFEFRRK